MPISNTRRRRGSPLCDGLDRVIHIGSFSKTLSASVRCGFIAARPDWIDGLVDLKIATNFSGGQLTAELLFSALKDGGYRKHIEALQVRLAKAMGETMSRLESIGITPWLRPQAGMFPGAGYRRALMRPKSPVPASPKVSSSRPATPSARGYGEQFSPLQCRAIDGHEDFDVLAASMRRLGASI